KEKAALKDARAFMRIAATRMGLPVAED
ncbi:hypothetical protein LCGC14_2335270, partial [marine sediment metagenome]